MTTIREPDGSFSREVEGDLGTSPSGSAWDLAQDGRRWFLRLGDGPWREVDKSEWVAAERGAGFRRKGGDNGEPATGGFGSSAGVSGRYVSPGATADQYAWDPAFAYAAFPTSPRVEDLVLAARRKVRALRVMTDRQRAAAFEEILTQLEVIATLVRALEEGRR